MSEKIRYPRSVPVESALSQDTLDRLTSQIFEWRQGPGAIGSLTLHACWGKTSVLAKRYQGQTVSNNYHLIRGAMLLFERTGNPRWKQFAGDVASNILFLQCEDGGFRHAVAEFEPCYRSLPTCPIHQNLPILALLDYAAWAHADETLKSLIRPAVDRHWEWFQGSFWLRGNGWQHPLAKAGWCGVTNQDLVAVAALSAYGRVYGDFSRYEEWGKKVLDVYFAPGYYHEATGLFERGDKANFAERTPYYHIILEMLERIYGDAGDERIPAIIDNVTLHLFDAAFDAPDGRTHLAWGAQTDEEDKSRVTGWIRTPVVFGSYPDLIGLMEKALARHPDEKKRAVLESLKKSLAAYVFSDGGLPGALWPEDPILSIVTSPAGTCAAFWRWLIERLGPDVRDPAPVPAVRLHRTLGGYIWKSAGPLWAIERDGARVYGGYKPLSHGVTHGDEEQPADGNFGELENYDILEILPD